jgi:hypothetical protein
VDVDISMGRKRVRQRVTDKGVPFDWSDLSLDKAHLPWSRDCTASARSIEAVLPRVRAGLEHIEFPISMDTGVQPYHTPNDFRHWTVVAQFVGERNVQLRKLGTIEQDTFQSQIVWVTVRATLGDTVDPVGVSWTAASFNLHLATGFVVSQNLQTKTSAGRLFREVLPGGDETPIADLQDFLFQSNPEEWPEPAGQRPDPGKPAGSSLSGFDLICPVCRTHYYRGLGRCPRCGRKTDTAPATE